MSSTSRQKSMLTTPVRTVVPYLILRSAAVRHSILAGFVMSALLSFVLNHNKLVRTHASKERSQVHLSIGVQFSLVTIVIGALYPCFIKVGQN
jgi:hypothetical protein